MLDTLVLYIKAVVAFLDQPLIMAFVPAFFVGVYVMLLSVEQLRAWVPRGYVMRALVFALLWALIVQGDPVSIYHIAFTIKLMFAGWLIGLVVASATFGISAPFWLPIVNRRRRRRANQLA